MKLNSYLLAGAAVVTLGSFITADAKAETIYTTVAPGTTVTTSSGPQIINESYTAIGTRKVGLVGYRPYPMKASHVESSTVRVNNPHRVVYTTAPGVASTTSVSTLTTTAGEPVSYSTGGGDYYTEDGTRYYNDPMLNISVRSTGSFND